MTGKAGATRAIERAQEELDKALARLAHVPNVDSDRLSYATHALNNYLMVVSAIAHVLRARMRNMSPQEIGERLEALNHATHLMKQMVLEVQGYGLENRPTLLLAPVDIRVVVEAACDEYEPVADEKAIALERDIPAAAIVVWTDRIALGAVLDNVLSNAIKYSKQGGTVRVHVRSTADEAICEISDAGPGISSADAPRVFTRGAKLSNRPTGGERSTGYGLAIAKDLVDALEGRIWFENAAAGGATFSVAIPMYDRERHPAD